MMINKYMSVKYNQSRSANKSVKVGDRAPGFTLPSLTGESVSLESFFGKKNIVLYFYPKDDTPGCTAEACSFRDADHEMPKRGVVVLGVSADDIASHR
jgi:thioredoxin-dependent peroxiredoxin